MARPGRRWNNVRWVWDLDGERELYGERRWSCIKLSCRQFGFIGTHTKWIAVKRSGFSVLREPKQIQ